MMSKFERYKNECKEQTMNYSQEELKDCDLFAVKNCTIEKLFGSAKIGHVFGSANIGYVSDSANIGMVARAIEEKNMTIKRKSDTRKSIAFVALIFMVALLVYIVF